MAWPQHGRGYACCPPPSVPFAHIAWWAMCAGTSPRRCCWCTHGVVVAHTSVNCWICGPFTVVGVGGIFCITDPNTDSARRSFVIFTLFLLNLFNFFCYLFLRICFANFCLVLQNFQLLLYIPLSLSADLWLICSTNSCLAGLALSVVSTQKKNTEFNNIKHALLRLTNDLCGATQFSLFFEVY